MVAVKTHEADRFIATRAKHIYLYLVHGTDAGLISERARAIARAWTPDQLQITRFAGDDIAAEPLVLIDEANSIGLFGGQRVIWISAGGKNFAGAIESLVSAPPSDCIVSIEAGSLKKDAPLRRLTERLREAAAIECYPDRAEDIERLIDTEVKAAGLGIEPEAKHALVHLLGGDRLTTRAELSKLILYADASALAMDDAVNGAFDGEYATVEETARRFFATGGDGSVLLGAAVRHALSLHRMCLDAENGASPEGLPAKYGRYGGARALVPQIKRWSSARMARAVSILADAVQKTRREPALDEPTAIRALWSVALAARPKP